MKPSVLPTCGVGETRQDMLFTYRSGPGLVFDPRKTQLATVTAIPDPAKAEQSFHMLTFPSDWGEACQ